MGRKAIIAVMVTAMALGTIAGCGGASDGETSTTDTPSAQAAADTSDLKTELGRRILEDGKVDDAEWAEAKDAFVKCDAEHGLTYTFDNDKDSSGGFKIPKDMEPETATTYDEQCAADTDFDRISRVRDLSQEELTGDEYLQAVVDCLTSNNLVEQGMTIEEYRQDLTDSDRREAAFGKYTDKDNPDYDATKAAQFESCRDNP